MSLVVAEHDVRPTAPRVQPVRQPRNHHPPRPGPGSWPATRRGQEEVLARLTCAPFVLASAPKQAKRVLGVRLLLEWLAEQPGTTWQEQWVSSGADVAGARWREVPTRWLRDRGPSGAWREATLIEALPVAISADILRPSLNWLVSGGPSRGGLLVRTLAASRDPEGFARIASRDGQVGVTGTTGSQLRYRAAQIVAAKGGDVAAITVGDVAELFDAEDAHRRPAGGRTAFYRVLRDLEIFGPGAPSTLRALSSSRQRTPEELIGRFGLVCQPIRDLLVDYLRERQPALDYTSLEALGYFLGKRFWADLEAHHPGIDSLRLPRQVADDWKRRLATFSKTTRTPTGERVHVTVPRINYRECLTPVRAFYLDLAHWAVEDPSRWGPWVAPSPVGEEEINRKKAKRHLKARMDARTRERLPVLPVVARSVDERRRSTRMLLDAARVARPGQIVAGSTLIRSVVGLRGDPNKVWVDEPATGKRRDLVREEGHAFWAWAIVEVLRATGIRVEELLELSHHSLVQYRLPTTGELVPLLQIAPSKTDTERLLVVSPDLADVLASIISRVRDRSGAMPLVASYDTRERLWAAPAPLLFQRRIGAENRPIAMGSVGKLLSLALAHTGLIDPVDDQPLHYTPHDFRRMFITDAILNGLPPHIAQIIAGHRDINVTLGYKAIYPEEAIQAHLSFLARRRALRPSEEYRVPTDQEWDEFLGHFERRKVSTGTCARAFGTPCIHEHACIRCPMLWPDPAQRARLIDIRDNLQARIAEAEREAWLGEVEGLQVSLAGAQDKLDQIDRRPAHRPVVSLGIPTTAPTTEEVANAAMPLPATR
jgi:integrase